MCKEKYTMYWGKNRDQDIMTMNTYEPSNIASKLIIVIIIIITKEWYKFVVGDCNPVFPETVV